MLTATELVDFGVDYITCTAKPGTKGTLLAEQAKLSLTDEAESGNEVKKWRGQGYSGLSSGAVSFGVGPQGTLARLSSGLAQRDWQKFYAVSDNCSRIDLQVTARFDFTATEVVSECWSILRAHWLKHSHLREPEVHCGPNGPHSISIGSRASDRCGRIYNKGHESKLDHYRDAVRFEGEFKGRVSRALAANLNRTGSRLPFVAPHILGLFRKSRLELGLFLHEPLQLCCPKKPSDATRRLRYLHTAVRPLIMSLIAQGFESEVLEALGLMDQRGPSWFENN